MPGDGTGPFLWLSEQGSPFGFRALPPGGLCLSSFLFVRRAGRPEILVGRYADDPAWERLTGLDASRRQAHAAGWTLPASHLKLGEGPMDAARRVLRDVLGLEGEPTEPRVVSEVGEPKRFPGMIHQDFLFLHEVSLPAEARVATPPWYAELAWIDPRATPASAWARSHDEVAARWLEATRSA